MTLKSRAIQFLNKLPYIRGLHKENSDFKKNAFFPAGHFYSPIISVDEIRQRQDEIWDKASVNGLEGINLFPEKQVALMNELSKYYEGIPFTDDKQENLRYHFRNDYYTYTDGIILYCMLRHFQPKRIIEVGSGFSSALMLDSNDLIFNKQLDLTFIEPNTARLDSLINENDRKNIRIIPKKVQEVPLDYFKRLEPGDFLFIDSTHVVKTGSDVNHILFEILPVLKPGVLIHFHDVFYPFEYPKDWVFQGWNWNEDYFLRAFLMYNSTFEVRLFAEYLHRHYPDVYQSMPLAYKNKGGNLWLEKKQMT